MAVNNVLYKRVKKYLAECDFHMPKWGGKWINNFDKTYRISVTRSKKGNISMSMTNRQTVYAHHVVFGEHNVSSLEDFRQILNKRFEIKSGSTLNLLNMKDSKSLTPFPNKRCEFCCFPRIK